MEATGADLRIRSEPFGHDWLEADASDSQTPVWEGGGKVIAMFPRTGFRASRVSILPFLLTLIAAISIVPAPVARGAADGPDGARIDGVEPAQPGLRDRITVSIKNWPK